MKLSSNLNSNNILLKTKATNRWNLIKEMVDLLVKSNQIDLSDSKSITKALIDREKSMSTGIGNGVAIPHCTSSKIKDIVVAITVIHEGIEFDSIDNQPVTIVILLLVPKNKLSQHIKTLANIAKLMSDEKLRNKILSLKTTEGIIKTIRKFEKMNQ